MSENGNPFLELNFPGKSKARALPPFFLYGRQYWQAIEEHGAPRV
jgi:hypothetical protein